MRDVRIPAVRGAVAGAVAMVVSAGCFYSSIPPAPTAPRSGKAKVYGKVETFKRNFPTTRTPFAGAAVRVRWYVGQSPKFLAFSQMLWTDGNGRYQAVFEDPLVTMVVVRACTCRYDPRHPDPKVVCCLSLAPTCVACADAWTPEVELPAHPDQSVRQDFAVVCPAAP